MRRLILFRHAKADPARPGESDFERPLAPRGRTEAALMGAYLARHRLLPDKALVSSARRTRETWDAASAAFGATTAMTTTTMATVAMTAEDRIYNASLERLFQIVESAPQAVGSLMVVGHNPGLHELALTLVATGEIDAREALQEKFPPAGIAVIDFAFDGWSELHPQCGRLERFVGPQTVAEYDR